MHTVVGPEKRIMRSFERWVGSGRAALVLLLCLTFCLNVLAQGSTRKGEGQSAARTDPAGPVSADFQQTEGPQRRVRRLGDVSGDDEWDIGVDAPSGLAEKSPERHLPDAVQDQRLQSLLESLEKNPGDVALQTELNQFLVDVYGQARERFEAGQEVQALVLLDVILSIKPDWSSAQETRALIHREQEISDLLAQGDRALREGRIDQPETASAWYFYGGVLDLDPDNEPAQEGLIKVQRDMIKRAVSYARELDFESAERILEDASYVREPHDLIEEAHEEIAQFRVQRSEELELEAVMAMDAGNFDRAERFLVELIALGGVEATVNQLRRRLEEARIYGGFRPGQIIRDHFLMAGQWTPKTVVVLAGSFIMGSAAFEEGRKDNEGPQHRVTFRRGYAIGQTEVSVREFRAFVDKTGYKTDADRERFSTIYDQFSGRLTKKDGVNWEMNYEGKPAVDDDPVVHVSWNDAQAYVDWLARGTGKPYRLPSEAEFEYALRGGQTTRYWWGDGTPGRRLENLTGEGDTSRSRRSWSTYFAGYADKYWGPAPVGTFVANPYGLYDISGNVGEWVRDCWHDTYLRAPADGSAWINPGCKLRVIRGGYWASSPDQTRSAFRLSAKPNSHDARIGFRIARDL